MKFYREQRKDWKKDWKIDKKAKNQAKQEVIPFKEWENQRLNELAKSSPEKFKEYCAGFKKAQRLKLWVGFGITAAVAALSGGVFADTALYYGIASASTKAALVPLTLIPVGTYLATVIATRKARAVNFLNKIWHKKDWKLRRIVTHFRKREKGQKLIQLKTFDSESYQKESRGYPAWVKRAKMPAIMQNFFKTGDISFDDTTKKVNDETKQNAKQTKEEIKREWYSQNLLNADKLNVSVYANEKTNRPDYFKLLGSFETDSFDKVLDKEKIGSILGEAGASVVNSLNDDLLVGVRTPDGDIRSDSSFTKINKKDYESKTQALENEDVPEATL